MPAQLTPSTRRLVLATVLLTVLLHGLMAVNFDLSTDEAHYALYGYFPALSYFDHPPLVGWSQIPFIALFGGNPPDWAMRLVPMAAHAATLWLLTVFTARHFGDSAARWTAVIIAVAPLPHMLGAAQVPDSLLIFWAAALLVQTDRLMHRPVTLRQWLLFGLTLGLAGLSKYTAAFFVPALLVCLISAQGGRVLLTAGPWVAALVSALVISPVVIWNAQHEWISFVYQGAHGTGNKAWEWGRAVKQLVLQLLVYGPLLTLLPLWLWRGTVAATQRPAIRLVLWLAVPFILIMLFLSGRSNALPHWTAPAWLLLAPLAGFAAARLAGRGAKILAGLQGLLCAALVGWMLSGGTPDPDGLNNPPADLYGWRAAGEHAQALAKTHQVEHLAVHNWSLASRLAWYARPTPLHVLDNRFDQFDLWYGDLPMGADAIVIDWSALSFIPPVGAGQFASCTALDAQDVVRWGKTLDHFAFFHCHQWGGQPAPVERAKAGQP